MTPDFRDLLPQTPTEGPPLPRFLGLTWSNKLKDPNGVKAEFGEPCWRAYNTALENLKFLAHYHDIDRVIEALKEDLRL